MNSPSTLNAVLPHTEWKGGSGAASQASRGSSRKRNKANDRKVATSISKHLLGGVIPLGEGQQFTLVVIM